jgi:hypothetical protein
LDVIGQIVDQPRMGMSDKDYCPWIKVAVCLNNCSGTAENMLAILRILFDKEPPVLMEEKKPNEVIFTFFEHPKFPLRTLFAIMRRAAPINTKCRFMQASPPPQSSGASKAGTGETDPELRPFCFDKTPFSESFLADFYPEESYE